ncbi:hypothetical protein ACE1TI_20905 [Alteribacillus sp. JSM 102045]
MVYYLVNPVLSYEAKKASLRKAKTDAIDAFHLHSCWNFCHCLFKIFN